MRLVPRVLPVLLFALSTAALAGAAELSLDRSAVADLLAAATPSSLEVEPAGRGKITIELGEPHGTDFVDGAVQTTLPIRIARSGPEVELVLRYVPDFEPLYGTPRLLVRPARWKHQ